MNHHLVVRVNNRCNGVQNTILYGEMSPLTLLLFFVGVLPHIGIAFTATIFERHPLNYVARRQLVETDVLSGLQRSSALFAKEEDEEKTDEPISLDEFLDAPFFDPDAYDELDESILGRIAAFVRQDYELAETLYVGLLFVVLVIISQELLRMQMYGDQYAPFSRGSTSGRLF